MKLKEKFNILKKCIYKIESMSTGVGPYLLNRVLTKKALLDCSLFKKKNLDHKHEHYVV